MRMRSAAFAAAALLTISVHALAQQPAPEGQSPQPAPSAQPPAPSAQPQQPSEAQQQQPPAAQPPQQPLQDQAQQQAPQGPAPQGPAPQGQAPDPKPRDLSVAPNAPNNQPEKQASAQAGMANICAELTAYLDQPKKPPAGATTGQQPPAVTAQQAGQQQSRSTERAGGPPPVDKPQHQSGITEPVPNASQGQTAQSPDDVRSIATGGDVMACQGAVKKMRLQGVALPAGLLALAALKPDLLRAGQQQQAPMPQPQQQPQQQ